MFQLDDKSNWKFNLRKQNLKVQYFGPNVSNCKDFNLLPGQSTSMILGTWWTFDKWHKAKVCKLSYITYFANIRKNCQFTKKKDKSDFSIPHIELTNALKLVNCI